MERFPIRTFTIATNDERSILHSPALPRPGVPYIDVTECSVWRLTIVAHERGHSTHTISEGELRITTNLEDFERLERVLMKAPRQSQGKRFPYSVLSDAPCVEFEAEKGQVVSVKLPG
jgi:hypothetical protein